MARARKVKARRQARRANPANDTGPAERWQHGDSYATEATDTAGVTRRRVETQTQLDRYYRRGQITEDQYGAGERLRRDWHLAGLEPSVVGSYGPKLEKRNRSAGIKQLEPTEAQADAQCRVREALQAAGKQLAPILVHVVLLDLPARDWCIQRGEEPKAGIVLLRLALDGISGGAANAHLDR